MKHIKNKRAFATGVITAIAALICVGIIMTQGAQPRFVISLIILIAWSMVSYFTAFTKKGVAEQASEYADERDRYIAQHSSHTTLLISNYLLFGGCFLGLFLYGVFKNTVFLTVAVTLCSVICCRCVHGRFAHSPTENRNPPPACSPPQQTGSTGTATGEPPGQGQTEAPRAGNQQLPSIGNSRN